MIPITDVSWQGQSWQTQLANSIRDTDTLARALNLELEDVITPFPINVPTPYLSRIRRSDPLDPLLLQILSTKQELSPSGLTSPLQEEAFAKGFGLIQKYQGRALVITTGACAIHCRYCFRRHFPYDQHQPSTEDWRALFQTLRQDTSISEVILSGGDPLMLKDSRLAWVLDELEDITHISSVRLHSRLPVVLPDRVTDALLKLLEARRYAMVLVTHVNHGNEIDEKVITRCRALASVGVTLLNQSVLLKGINDSTKTLEVLSRKLIAAGIVPYYLHLMDPVQGAEHFNVADVIGIELISQLRSRLPGYLVPRLSRETPFEDSKTVIA